MIEGLELFGAYLLGVLTLPLAGAVWWRGGWGKRWLARKLLGAGAAKADAAQRIRDYSPPPPPAPGPPGPPVVPRR